jgi:hypothetical protein
MSDSPYIPPQPQPPPSHAPEPLVNEHGARRRSSRIAAQRKEIRSIDLCSTGSAAKNELLKRTSRSKASSKRSASISSSQRIPTPTAPHAGLALTEDNLLAHISSTNSPPQTRGAGLAQSIQLGKQGQDDETASSLSLDSEDIRYYTEKLRRKRVPEVKPDEPTQTNPICLNDSDVDILTTPQLIEKVNQSNPGWQGDQDPLSGLQEILHPNYTPASLFDVNIPANSNVNYSSIHTTNYSLASPVTPPLNKFINLDLEKTPRSPAIIRASSDMVKALKGTDKDENPFHTSMEQN